MGTKTMFQVQSYVLSIFGLGTLAIPEIFWGIFGISFEAVALLFARVAGSLVIGNAFLSYRMRGIEDAKTHRELAKKFLFEWSATLVIFVLGQTGGMFNTLGWANVGLILLFVVGWSLALRKS